MQCSIMECPCVSPCIITYLKCPRTAGIFIIKSIKTLFRTAFHHRCMGLAVVSNGLRSIIPEVDIQVIRTAAIVTGNIYRCAFRRRQCKFQVSTPCMGNIDIKTYPAYCYIFGNGKGFIETCIIGNVFTLIIVNRDCRRPCQR